jgi:hypothetical protein
MGVDIWGIDLKSAPGDTGENTPPVFAPGMGANPFGPGGMPAFPDSGIA